MIWARVCAWVVALEYFIKQNNFFGWNSQPKSEAEVLADGIFLLLVAFAIAITAYEPSRTRIVFRDRAVVISPSSE